MLEIQINSPIPIYEQLITGIKEMIHTGDLKIGESLPSIRSLATTLDIAVNTVARAYNDLERIGYVKSFGVKGTFVCERVNKEQEIFSGVSELVKSLLEKGLSNDQIHQLIEEQIGLLKKSNS